MALLTAEIMPFEDPVVCIEVGFEFASWARVDDRSTERVYGMQWRRPCRNGLHKKGKFCAEEPRRSS
jgi:hypothetical protein